MKKLLAISGVVLVLLSFFFIESISKEVFAKGYEDLEADTCSQEDPSSETCPEDDGWTKIDSGDLSLYPVDGATEYCFKAGPYTTAQIPEGGFGQEGPCTEDHIERCDLSHWSYFIPPEETETPEPSETVTDTPEPTVTETETETPEPTVTETETETPEPTVTETETETPEPTVTETETETPEPTVTETDTETPEPTVTETETETPEPTGTPTDSPIDPGGDYGIGDIKPIPLEIPEIPNGKVVEIKIHSPMFNSWYKDYWKNELFIIEPNCAPNCTTEEIEAALEYSFNQDRYWVAVKIGQVYYTHSGWPKGGNPYFGEPFKRVAEQGNEIGADWDKEYLHMTDYTSLLSSEPVFVKELFNNVGPNEKFVVYCGSLSTLVTRLTP